MIPTGEAEAGRGPQLRGQPELHISSEPAWDVEKHPKSKQQKNE